MQWSNQEWRPSVWSAAAENFNEICKVKARLRAVLQITSAQQRASIHFILPHLKSNRTGGSTHWRRKHKTRSIRSTKSDGLATRIRCSHNKRSDAMRCTFARLYSSVCVSLRVLHFVTRRWQHHTDSILGCFIRPQTHIHMWKLEWSNYVVDTSAHSAAG